MVKQALKAVKGDTKKIYGIFAEAFQESTSPIGGGPQIMAELYHHGVPFENMDNITVGLTDVNPVTIKQEFIDNGRYMKTYRRIIRASQRNPLYQYLWSKSTSAK